MPGKISELTENTPGQNAYIEFVEGGNNYKAKIVDVPILQNNNIVGTITTNDIAKTITITGSNGTSTVYKETGFITYDANGNIIVDTTGTRTGAYLAGKITYTSGTGPTSVDGNTGKIETPGTDPSYNNQNNTFTETQTFDKPVVVNSDVLSPIYSNTVNTSTFNINNGIKQKFSFTDSGTHIMNFQNLKIGSNYEFFIVVSGGSATLSFNGTTFTNCDTIIKAHGIGGSITGSNVLTVGTHHFVASTAIEAVHISYTGISVQINS